MGDDDRAKGAHAPVPAVRETRRGGTPAKQYRQRHIVSQVEPTSVGPLNPNAQPSNTASLKKRVRKHVVSEEGDLVAAANKAVIYCRTATSSGSIRDQEDQLRLFADVNRLEIVKVYMDGAVSGLVRDRDGLNSMLVDAQLRNFQWVLVAGYSRIARDVTVLGEVIAALRLQGIEIASLYGRLPKAFVSLFSSTTEQVPEPGTELASIRSIFDDYKSAQARRRRASNGR